MKAIIHEPLRLPRYEEMTIDELMARAKYARMVGRYQKDNKTALAYFRTCTWILEMAAKAIG